MTSKELVQFLESADVLLADLAKLSPLCAIAETIFPQVTPIISLAAALETNIRTCIAYMEPIVQSNIVNPDPAVGPDPTQIP
jgi:hypothetical protein